MGDPVAFAAKHAQDTMYFHQDAKQPDAPYFIDAIIKEINSLIERGHWELIPIEKVPKGTEIIDGVWGIKYKRNQDKNIN
eukprot:4111402-Ditylum_brightwellii.AAC.1